jgi:hypothetical protein
MKKRFSDEQIISILREAEAGYPPVSMPFPHAISRRKKYLHGGVKVMAVWKAGTLAR